MPPTLTCLPDGLLCLTGDAAPDFDPELAAAFQQSPAHAVVALASRPSHESPADPALPWLQRFSHHWMAAVCRTRQPDPSPPTADASGRSLLADWIDEAPPFPGSEYLNP